MNQKLLYVTCLFLLILPATAESKSNSSLKTPTTCPGEWSPSHQGKLFGFRVNDSCITLKTVDWTEHDSQLFKSYHHQLLAYMNYGGCSKLIDGRLYTHYWPEKLMKGSWSKSLMLEYVSYGYGVDSGKIYYALESFIWDWREWSIDANVVLYDADGEKIIEENVYVATDVMGFTLKKKHYRAIYHIFDFLDFSSADEYKKRLMPEIPLYPTYKIKLGEIVHDIDWKTLEGLKKLGTPLYYACIHQPYKDCIEKKINVCHYDSTLDGWYDAKYVIQRRNDEPWGKPCTNLTVDKYAKPCNASCRGDWSSWIGHPQPPCGVYTIKRYRPEKQGDSECRIESSTCCVEVKTVYSSQECSDFAYNSTVNLKTLGCNHNKPLRIGKTGHLECDCGPLYGGIRCETDLCKDKCHNGATCLAFGKGSICVCKPGFEGNKCEKLKPYCGHAGKCENGGSCIQTTRAVGAYCKCPPMFGGLSCESTSGFCRPNTCNGHGLCANVTESNSFICSCYDGFSGTQCETKDYGTELVYALHSGEHMVSFLAVALLIAAVFLFCSSTMYIRHRRRRRRRRHGSESTSTAPSSIFSTIAPRFRPRKRAARTHPHHKKHRHGRH